MSPRAERADHPDRAGHQVRRPDAALLASGGAGRRAAGRAAGQGGARARPGFRAVPRRARPARAARPRLPAPRRRPRLRPPRGWRPALPVPRLAVRRRRQVPRDAGRARGQRALPEGAPDAPIRSWSRTASSSPTSATARRPPSPTSTASSRPGTHAFAFKGLIDCNWLQALEVGIDPAHASYLHRFYEDEDPSGDGYGKQFRAASSDSDIPMTRMMREYTRPTDRRRGHGLRPAPVHAAQDQREAHARAGDQPRLPLRLRDPDEHGDDDHPVARADRRHLLLLVRDLHLFGKPVDHAADARAAAAALRAARLPPAPRPPQQLRLQRRRAEDPDLYRHGLRHQRPRPVGDREPGPHPGPHARASRHARQGDRRLPPPAAVGDRPGRQRREAADVARSGARRHGPRPDHRRRHGLRPRAGRPTGRSSTLAGAAARAGPPPPCRRWSPERHASRRKGRSVDRRPPDRRARGRAPHPGGRAHRRAPLLRRPARHPARQDAGRRRDRRGDEERRRLHHDHAAEGHRASHGVPGVGHGRRLRREGMGGRGRRDDAARSRRRSACCPGRRTPAGCCATSSSPTAGRCRSARAISIARRSSALADAGYDFVAGLEVEFHLFKLEKTKLASPMPASPASPARRPTCRCSTRATST